MPLGLASQVAIRPDDQRVRLLTEHETDRQHSATLCHRTSLGDGCSEADVRCLVGTEIYKGDCARYTEIEFRDQHDLEGNRLRWPE